MGLTVGIHQIRAQAIGSPARGYTRMGSARKKVRVRALMVQSEVQCPSCCSTCFSDHSWPQCLHLYEY